MKTQTITTLNILITNQDKGVTTTLVNTKNKALNMIQIVCQTLEIQYEELKTKNRSRDYSDARSIIFSLLYHETRLSQQDIGRLLNKDQSTVSCGIRSFNNLIETDKPFINKLSRVLANLPEYSKYLKKYQFPSKTL